MSAPKEYLSIREVADIVGVESDTIRRAIASKKLKAVKAGKQIRITRRAVDAWLEPIN